MGFYVWMKQAGEGCGYSIGCGERLVPVEGETVQEATNEAHRVFEYHGFGSHEECQPQECKLMQEVADLMPEVVKHVDRHQEAKHNEEKAAKLKQLERLKRELGVE